MPIPEATMIRAEIRLVRRRRRGLMSDKSSQRPIIRVKREARRMPERCLSMGKNKSEVIKRAVKIGNPPPRGTVAEAVAFLVFLFLTKGSSTQAWLIKKLRTRGVIKKEMVAEMKMLRKKLGIM